MGIIRGLKYVGNYIVCCVLRIMLKYFIYFKIDGIHSSIRHRIEFIYFNRHRLDVLSSVAYEYIILIQFHPPHQPVNFN